VDTGKPITVFAITALTLWSIYLWRQGRLGKPGLLPHPADLNKSTTADTSGSGWREGHPPLGQMAPIPQRQPLAAPPRLPWETPPIELETPRF
jgi:hypothetical protein